MTLVPSTEPKNPRCPSRSVLQDLPCIREDTFKSHLSLCHINGEWNWPISLEDRKRWGVQPNQQTVDPKPTKKEPEPLDTEQDTCYDNSHDKQRDTSEEPQDA